MLMSQVPLQGYLAHKKHPLLGPYSRNIPKVLWWSWVGGAVSYERGTPVGSRRKEKGKTFGREGLDETPSVVAQLDQLVLGLIRGLGFRV